MMTGELDKKLIVNLNREIKRLNERVSELESENANLDRLVETGKDRINQALYDTIGVWWGPDEWGEISKAFWDHLSALVRSSDDANRD